MIRKSFCTISRRRGFTRTLNSALFFIVSIIKSMPLSFFKIDSHKSGLRKNKTMMPNLVSGFTLIETIVAIFIISISLAGPLNFINTSLSAIRYASDQTTAFYLGQEAMEYVKNAVDTNILKGADSNKWIDNNASCSGCVDLGVCLHGIGGCRLDAQGASITVTNIGGSPPPIKYDNGVYRYSSGTDTSFYRRIYIEKRGSGVSQEANIFVEMKWTPRGSSSQKTLILKDIVRYFGS